MYRETHSSLHSKQPNVNICLKRANEQQQHMSANEIFLWTVLKSYIRRISLNRAFWTSQDLAFCSGQPHAQMQDMKATCPASCPFCLVIGTWWFLIPLWNPDNSLSTCPYKQNPDGLNKSHLVHYHVSQGSWRNASSDIERRKQLFPFVCIPSTHTLHAFGLQR